MPESSRYDLDPEALAWARANVRKRIDHYDRLATHARNEGKEDLASRMRKHANLLRMDFIGGTGCVIALFDERLPEMIRLEEKATARDDRREHGRRTDD